MSDRKTVQVKPEVHQRLEKMLQALRGQAFNYDRSNSGVIEYLMDFYENHNTNELRMALELVRTVRRRLEQEPGQLDIYTAIKKAQEDRP